MTGLTPAELRFLELTAELADLTSEIVGHGRTRQQDMNELGVQIHALQHTVMAQSAARAHPELFRLLGGVVG